MKKVLIILMIAAMQQFVVVAQDLLVTSDGDSLNCKITKIKDEYMYFTFKHQDEVRNTLVPVAQVVSYQYNFYNSSFVQPHQIVGYRPKFPNLRLAANCGWSYRTATIPDDFDPAQKEYIKKLKHGLNIGLEASYFFSEMFGAGLMYDLFKTSNAIYYGEDNISIIFVGPSFAMRLFDRSKTNCMLVNYGIGYMGFKDKAKELGNPIIINGSTVGLVMNIGYDFSLSKNWSAGIQLSLLSGILTEYNETRNGVTQKIKLEKDQYEGLGRINISIGLRYNL